MNIFVILRCQIGCQDELSVWWSNILSIAAYWLLGEETEAEQIYEKVDDVPKLLLDKADTLPRVLKAAFEAKKALL